MDALTQLGLTVTELRFALDTFYFLLSGALVMWMAAGFAMLEAGLVRSKTRRKSSLRISAFTLLPALCICWWVTTLCMSIMLKRVGYRILAR